MDFFFRALRICKLSAHANRGSKGGPLRNKIWGKEVLSLKRPTLDYP